jgi:N-acetyl sugar amidotransferase
MEMRELKHHGEEKTEYRICSKTVMDTDSDPDIFFDENGVCNYVGEHANKVRLRVPDEHIAEKLLKKKLDSIKNSGKGKDYDCIVGVSGGVDSTYTAYITKKLGLRPLAVHIDNGWNSELAVSNIEKTLKKLDIQLYTKVLDWNVFRDIQLSFLKASVPDGEIPTDHAIYSVLFNTAKMFGIKYIISGTNMRTEGLRPQSWASGHLDWQYIKSIHKKFGKLTNKPFPKVTLKNFVGYLLVKRIKQFSILDYVPYSKKQAMDILINELKWVDYGGKHYESIYTRFFQGFILPEKFGIDKRKYHLSNLIISGEITREEALEQLEKMPYPSVKLLQEDRTFVLKKLNLSETEFEKIMKLKIKSIYDYPNNIDRIKKLTNIWNKLTGIRN